MLRLLRLLAAPLLSLILVLLGAPAASATAGGLTQPASTTNDQNVTARLADTGSTQVTQTLRYWTPQRMATAAPVDSLLVQAGDLAARVPRAVPTAIPPTKALADALEPQAANSTGAPWTGGGAVTRTAGRVFFTVGGQDASCSGNAVTSENRSVVVTAGHCVRYQGEWATNWVFVPGYDNGDRPYGTWTARQLLTTTQWANSGNINYDVGMAVVNTRGGQHLTAVVGGQGIAFNQPRGQQMYAFGYPAADPYSGQRLIYCSGQAFDDPLFSNDQGLYCDMTGGSSGGPWFLSFSEATGTGVQNSVNSFKYVFFPNIMFGPYFGGAVQDLYQRAETA